MLYFKTYTNPDRELYLWSEIPSGRDQIDD